MLLSHSQDVLMAIAGIASVFEAQLKSKSTYGLWVDFLVTELLWRRSDPNEATFLYDTSSNYLPSWS
jgi:hypothetical protein